MTGRVFAYCRVSKKGLETDNQVGEIRAAGFDVTGKRVVSEVVSGGTPVERRPGFMKLLDRLEAGDVLVVTKLDRLGRNAIDVIGTVKRLEAEGVKVHCLQLGGVDLTSSAGKMVTSVIATMAEFERDLLIERTNAGLDRARKAGTKLGRKAILTASQREDIRKRIVAGASVAALAREYKTSRMTIMRARDGEAA